MSAIEITPDTLSQLAKYETPAVCDAVELWGLRPHNTGYMNDSISACFPKMQRMVGFALTSTFCSMAPARKDYEYACIEQQLEAFAELPGPPVIVFQHLDGSSASASFGEGMCYRYKAFGAKGIITSGAGRDLDQVEALGFPAFTSGTICGHGYWQMLAINVPVTVGGITIYPGDLLHGDRNGVTTIPLEIASEVPDVCGELMSAEQAMYDSFERENVNLANYSAAHQEYGDRIARLRRRLRGETSAPLR
jgi:regulator of RNase E activity RraA